MTLCDGRKQDANKVLAVDAELSFMPLTAAPGRELQREFGILLFYLRSLYATNTIILQYYYDHRIPTSG